MPACAKCLRDAPQGALFCSHCGTAIKPETGAGEAADPLIGQTVAGKYFIHQLLGHGGMGDVYKATHLTLDRPVVLKLLRKLFHSDPSLVQRFHREARAASRLNHPNSITIIDFGQTDDGTLFMAMEFLPGRGLERIIHDDYPLAEGRIIHIVVQVLAALGEAHALGIIHRDLKPANVMVEARRDEPDFVKVLDFGIAKLSEPGAGGGGLTQAGIVCGTPGYMSPEQVRGENLDARSDLYAVGVILYEMLTGVLPFDSDTPMGLVTRHLVEEPPPMSERRPGLVVSPELEAIVMRALARERDARFPSAEEMRAALLECGEAAPRPVRGTPPPSTVIFDPSALGPSKKASRARAPAAPPAPPTGIAEAGGSAVPLRPPRTSWPAPPAGGAPAPARPAVGKTPAPAARSAPRAGGPATPAGKTPAPAGKTPAPSAKPPTGPGARVAPAPKPAPVIHHELDEEQPEVEESPAPPAARSKAPIIAAAGAAAVVLGALVVWGVTHRTEPSRSPVAAVPANAPVTPPAPVARAAQDARAQPVAPPIAGPRTPPAGEPAQAEPSRAPAPPREREATAAAGREPPPKVPSAEAQAPRARTIRLVKAELNAIPVPSAASGDGILAIQATPWAEVSINGRSIGETPREVLLRAGVYRVRASHPELGVRDQAVRVKAGAREVLNLTFAR